jgi:hypothetical protein
MANSTAWLVPVTVKGHEYLTIPAYSNAASAEDAKEAIAERFSQLQQLLHVTPGESSSPVTFVLGEPFPLPPPS